MNLDANAGLPATAAARAAYREACVDFANPSSPHVLGRRAAQRLAAARAAVATALGAEAGEIVFTSGGTEANALAILGVVRAAGERVSVVTTAIEHPSVTGTLTDLAEAGEIDLDVVPVERHGRVDPQRVLAAVRPETRLVSVMAANNETGVLQPVAEIAAGLSPGGVLLHVDAVQAVARVPDAAAVGDLVSLSGHKLGAVAGIGALRIRAGVEIAALLIGGGQEQGRRASTENVAGAASLAAALAEPHDTAAVAARRDQLEAGLRAVAEAQTVAHEVIGAHQPRLGNTTCVRFCDIEGDALMMALDQLGVAISTGSACSVGAIEPSPALLGMGLSAREASQVVRYSLTTHTTDEEIARAIAATGEVLGRLVRNS